MASLSVIAVPSSEDLAYGICDRIGGDFVRASVRTFPDGESKVTLGGMASEERSVVVQSSCPPVDTNLIQLLSLIAKAKERSAAVTAVVPYMGYARQDREFLPGEVVTMRVLGRLFAGAGASNAVTVDVHSAAGLEQFALSTKNVSAVPALAEHFRERDLKNPIAVSPDLGGKDRAREFGKAAGIEHTALEKSRDRGTGAVRITTKNASEVRGRDVVLIDDMISTGGSIVKATQFLRKHGCLRVSAACTHALMVGGAEEKMREAGVSEIVSTNTIPGGTSVVDVSGIIAEAL